MTRPLLRALFTEWQKPAHADDESIWDFIVRRFNKQTAERLFDPLIVGIYAGDMQKLSIKSCFPQLKRWEEEYGSLTRGFLLQKKTKTDTFGLPSSALFSLQGGVETLINKLAQELGGSIQCGQKITELRFSSTHVTVASEERSWDAEYLFSALPPYELAKYFTDSALISSLTQIPFQDMATVHMGFRKSVLPLAGFGYLVPTYEKQEILGTIFDSNLFPEQNSTPEETRLSTMLLCRGGDYQTRALSALRHHLKITSEPDTLAVTETRWAIPQFEVGHEKRMAELLAKITAFSPRLHLVGNYLAGASVSDAVAYARKSAQNFSLFPSLLQPT